MKITTDLLRQWEACTDGYGWFIRKFPQGADYGVVQQALRDDSRFDDSSWLTDHAFGHLLVEPAAVGDITADAKAASDKLIADTTALKVEVEKVGVPAESDNSGDYARIGSSGYSAQIGSSGNYAQIGSSGNYAQIGSSGDYAQIGSSGNSAQIGSSGDYARIGSSGDYAQIGSSGYYARIGSSGNYAQIVAAGENAVIAVAGFGAQFKVGPNASVSVAYLDSNERARFAVGYVGENIKADTWYRVTESGVFEEVETGELADAA
ncbi:hypothetical protein [Paraburkholderia sp.]|uniref:hypothetical protein n=1 Tax=Paraburkholderia sp. TaxID=1926495 RepID=UPI0025F30C42|nr:hypothetical protein [Paraburkholderia sp.]